jgi:hypothetical protein
VSTYFRSANTAQFGGKSSISMHGPTGSTNTGKAGGAAALVISAARETDIELSADETRELLEQTAEDVLPGQHASAWATPTRAAGLRHATSATGASTSARRRCRRPTATASRPRPRSLPRLVRAGHRARRCASPAWPRTGLRKGGEFRWKLEWGSGAGAAGERVEDAGSGKGPPASVTDFGDVDLNAVRAALAARTPAQRRDMNDPAGPTFDPTRTDPFEGQFTVRLTVTSSEGKALRGVDRKVLTAIDDPTLRPGLPQAPGHRRRGAAALRRPRRRQRQELVLPTEDGLVHAYRPDGSELPGWPVRTETQFVARAHGASPALRASSRPRAAAGADDRRPHRRRPARDHHDGGERIYAWHADGPPSRLARAPRSAAGQLRPRSAGQAAQAPEVRLPRVAVDRAARRPRPARPRSSPPAWTAACARTGPTGPPTPGFPVQLIDPDLPADKQMTAESINNAAIGDLDGDGRDEVVIATNEVYGSTNSGGDVSFFDAVGNAAGTTSRVYAVRSTGTASPGGKPFLPGWPIKLSGIIQDVLPLIGPGHDPAIYVEDGKPRIVVSTTGGALAIYAADGSRVREIQQQATPGEGALNLFESAVVGDINGNGLDVVKYQIDLGQAANLLLVGQNVPYSHRIGAYDTRTGTTNPGWPVITDDYQFLSSSTIGQVRPGSSQQVLAGTGLGLLHAYDGVTGRDAPGFPKVTGGWLFAPAALSDDGRVAGITREGYLFEWSAPETPAVPDAVAVVPPRPAGHRQPRRGRHAARDPGPHDARSARRRSLPAALPLAGDDGFCGRATRYVASVDGERIDLGAPADGGARFNARSPCHATAARSRSGPPTARPARPSTSGHRRRSPGPDPRGEAHGQAVGDPSARRAPVATPRRAGADHPPRLRPCAGDVPRRGADDALHRQGRRQARAHPLRPAHPAPPGALGTGILTIRYPGDADTRSQVVRLRAAGGRAALRTVRPRIASGRLRASGRISRAARGVVRLQIEYVVGDRTVTVPFRARVRRGRWSINAPLPTPLRSGLGVRSGTVHSYILFTGYLPRRMRGEMRSFQVLGER